MDGWKQVKADDDRGCEPIWWKATTFEDGAGSIMVAPDTFDGPDTEHIVTVSRAQLGELLQQMESEE